MIRRSCRTASIALAVFLAVLLIAPSGALASQSFISSGPSGIDNDYWVNFSTGRTVTASGSNIYFEKQDGPGLYMMWYRCSNVNVRGPGSMGIYWSDPDPQKARTLDTGFALNAVFCLRVLSNGADDKDEFSGILYWNLYSNPNP